MALAAASSAAALTFDTGNPDLELRWDNTIRATGGLRMEQRDPGLANSPANDEGTFRFDRGDMVTQRLDLLSELEMAWKKDFGLRISAAGWYDRAYRDGMSKQNPLLAAAGVPSSYINNRYSPVVDRFYHGPSGEVLDAFVYGNWQVGESPLSLKVGKFSTFWGTALFYGGGIAASQQPIDARKAQATPGAEVRELFLPLNQVLLQSQISKDVALAAQYYLDWAPTRFPEGGTYLAPVDFVLEGPDRLGVSNTAIGFLPRLPAETPKEKRGNFGLSAKFTPDFLSGHSAGVYYREFDDKFPWLLIKPGQGYRAVYGEKTQLLGVSYAGNIGAVSVAAEAGYHKNAALNSRALGVGDEGARGNTWHAVVNAISSLNSPLWDSAVLVAELSYDRLGKVTKNASLFNGLGTANCVNNAVRLPGSGTASDGCATKDSFGLAIALTPQYNQVLPGVNLSIPLVFRVGLKGNTSTAAPGNNEGTYSYSIGVTADVYNKHTFSLAYTDSHARTRTIAGPLGPLTVGGNGLGFGNNDRGWLALTYKTAF